LGFGIAYPLSILNFVDANPRYSDSNNSNERHDLAVP
jgi:hypothetical protein